MVRLQKYLSEAGVASRRASEQIISDGRVSVNGKLVRELGTKVDPKHDRVVVDGQLVKPRRKIYIAFNKPRGVMSTRKDTEDRQTIHDLLPAEWRHLYSVGRLDRDSEGLIFLTNDGEFSLHLTHPRYGVTKKYHLHVDGKVQSPIVEQMIRGVREKGELLRAQKVRIVSASNSQSLLELDLREGKYREIRRMCDVLGLKVRSLRRIQIGKIKLGELKPGKWRALTESEITTLLTPI